MVKFIILYGIVLILLAVFSKKPEDNAARKTFFYLHLFGGILFAAFAAAHGIGHFQAASLGMQITGGATILCLLTEIIAGICLYKNKSVKARNLHKWLVILIPILALVHLLLQKLL